MGQLFTRAQDMEAAAPPGWREKLAQAHTPFEVVIIARDFVDRLEAYEIEELPEACKPRPFSEPGAISEYAYDLKRCSQTAAGDAAITVAKLGAFFTEAAYRITFLTGPHRMGAHGVVGAATEAPTPHP